MSNDLLNGTHTNPFENIDWSPLMLADRQRELCNLLDREGGGKYQLGNLYSGAIRVLSDPNNPDRIAQAANSLREVLEKLLLLVFGYVRKDRSEFSKIRSNMAYLLMEYKETGDDGVKEKLHDKLGEYLELNEARHATRAEQMGAVAVAIYAGDNKLAKEKGEQAKKLWYKLDSCAHHGKCDDSFEKILEEFEKTVDLILANVVVINQKEIQKIVQSNDRSKQGIEHFFRLIGNNEANRRYFFKLITEKTDATWLTIIRERGYFKSPPEVEHSNDGWMTIPFWLPMPYLIEMASYEPDKVAKIVANIPTVDSSYVSAAKKIIEQRLSSQAEHALKPEEYAILGVNYLRLHFLDKEWARKNRLKLFPQNNLSAWSAAFGASISYCESRKEMFEIVRENFTFAMQNLNELSAKDNYGDEILSDFELKLFNFYLAGDYPLVGNYSLLDQYYQKTASDKKEAWQLTLQSW